jgi:hypothetical protein
MGSCAHVGLPCSAGVCDWFAIASAEQLAAIVAMPEGSIAEQYAHAESLIHAISAVAKWLFPAITTSDVNSTTQAVMRQACAAWPHLPQHPALQRTLVLLLGAIWPWLAGHPEQLNEGFAMALRSLEIPEEDATYPMRLAEDHVGCVALIKLARAPDSGAMFAAVFRALRLQYSQPTVTFSSRKLLLEAAAQCAVHADSAAIYELLQAAFQQVEAALGLCRALPHQAWTSPRHLALLDAALEEAVIVTRKTTARPEVLTLMTTLFTDAGSHRKAFAVQLLLGDGALAPCPVPAVAERLRDLAVCALGMAQPEVEGLAHAVMEVFWDHFNRVGGSPAALSTFQACLERCLPRFATLQHVFAAIVPAVVTGLDTGNFFASENPWCDLAVALFSFVGSAVAVQPGLVEPCAVQAVQLLACETLAPSCQTLLASPAVCRALFGLLDTLVHRDLAGNCFLDVALQQREELGPSLLAGLLGGVCLLFPSHMLEEAVACLRNIMMAYRLEVSCAWLAEAIRQPDFPRVSVSEKAKGMFVEEVAKSVALPSLARLKSTVKKFCGGKKKGTAGTPASSLPAVGLTGDDRQLSCPVPVRFSPHGAAGELDEPGDTVYLRSHSV